MSNKTQLQLNNETLASILSNVLGLPSQESLKHGAYVWKKSEYTPSGTISVSFISTSSTETKVQLSSNDVDLSTLQDDDFITLGLGGTMDAISISASTKVFTKYKFLNLAPYKLFVILPENESGRIGYGYSFDATTNILTLTNSNGSGYALPELNLSSMTVPAITGDFIDFTVSDSPTAYPDGGLQDGYWYEKVVEGLDPALFGHTKVSFGEVTPSSDLQTITVNHNLGGIPKMMLYYTPDNLIGTTYTKAAIDSSDDIASQYGYAASLYGYGSSYDYYNVSACSFESITETSAVLTGRNKSSKFKAGSTYHWLALA